MKILVINTGGTFNKVYDEISGSLKILKNNNAVKEIIKKYMKKTDEKVKLKGMIYKDSLEMTNKDRDNLLNVINNSPLEKIIIIHGTDTIDITASFLNINLNDKKIILVGAMKPFSIEPIEATANFASAYGFLQNLNENGIYISMHGHIEKFHKIRKNKKIGIFESV